MMMDPTGANSSAIRCAAFRCFSVVCLCMRLYVYAHTHICTHLHDPGGRKRMQEKQREAIAKSYAEKLKK